MVLRISLGILRRCAWLLWLSAMMEDAEVLVDGEVVLRGHGAVCDDSLHCHVPVSDEQQCQGRWSSGLTFLALVRDRPRHWYKEDPTWRW